MNRCGTCANWDGLEGEMEGWCSVTDSSFAAYEGKSCKSHRRREVDVTRVLVALAYDHHGDVYGYARDTDEDVEGFRQYVEHKLRKGELYDEMYGCHPPIHIAVVHIPVQEALTLDAEVQK